MNIDKIIGKYKNTHSLFQLNFFVLGKEPTIQGKLKRCADELRTRKNSIDNALLEIEEIDDQIELLKLDHDVFWHDDDKRRKVIKLRQIDRKIKHLEKQVATIQETIQGLTEECNFFTAAYEELSKVEEPKDWGSEEVQLEYWATKYAKEIKERLVLQMPIDMEIIRSVLALPDQAAVKQQVLQLMQKQEQLMLKQDK